MNIVLIGSDDNLPEVANPWVPPAWHAHAACKRMGPTSLYADRGNSEPHTARAKLVCAACVVRTECLTYALDACERHGVWGGATVNERKEMRMGRRAIA